jgi:hypothetical protein
MIDPLWVAVTIAMVLLLMLACRRPSVEVFALQCLARAPLSRPRRAGAEPVAVLRPDQRSHWQFYKDFATPFYGRISRTSPSPTTSSSSPSSVANVGAACRRAAFVHLSSDAALRA